MAETESTLGQLLGATKTEGTLLVLFIPSVDRESRPIDQETWVSRALDVLGELFGGAPLSRKAGASGETTRKVAGWSSMSQ